MCKEKLAALTAEKDALQLELDNKTKELEEAQRLILEYSGNRTRLKWTDIVVFLYDLELLRNSGLIICQWIILPIVVVPIENNLKSKHSRNKGQK